jgi:hypothetical protein
MSYTLQNALIFNEAFAAFIFANANAVASAGTPPSTSPDAPSGTAYAGTELMTQANAFAQAVDTAILNDSTISGGDGIALQPSTAVIQQHQMLKTAAVRACCNAFLAPGGSWAFMMPGGAVTHSARRQPRRREHHLGDQRRQPDLGTVHPGSRADVPAGIVVPKNSRVPKKLRRRH